jgi:thiol:disulfide interchange protein DsbC
MPVFTRQLTTYSGRVMFLRKSLAAALLSFIAMGSAQANEAEVRNKLLESRIAGGETAEIVESEVPGMFEVTAGGNIFFATADGRYLFQGKVYDLVQQKELTASLMDSVRKKALAGISDAETIVFMPPEGTPVKNTLTVFTDIDCHFCRELHKEMDGYLANGIKIRYLFFPRAGLRSAAAKKAENVWCAADRNTAMDTAKAEKPVADASCPNPVAKHYSLGRTLGVSATPTMMTSEGVIIRGFRRPSELDKMLN